MAEYLPPLSSTSTDFKKTLQYLYPIQHSKAANTLYHEYTADFLQYLLDNGLNRSGGYRCNPYTVESTADTPVITLPLNLRDSFIEKVYAHQDFYRYCKAFNVLFREAKRNFVAVCPTRDTEDNPYSASAISTGIRYTIQHGFNLNEGVLKPIEYIPSELMQYVNSAVENVQQKANDRKCAKALKTINEQHYIYNLTR